MKKLIFTISKGFLLTIIFFSIISCVSKKKFTANQSDLNTANEQLAIAGEELNEALDQIEFLKKENQQLSSNIKQLSENDFFIDTISSLTPTTLALEYRAKLLHQKLIDSLPTFQISYGSGDDLFNKKYFIVEGDIKLDREELYYYCLKRLQKTDTNYIEKKLSNKLTVITDKNGKAGIWPNSSTIYYTVMRSSFDSKAKYDDAVLNMKQAVQDWMDVCNIKFVHQIDQDKMDVDLEKTNLNPLFIVRQFNVNGEFIAQAFFPTDPPFKRMLLLDNSFFDSEFDKTGVLRHELGHVLGFRHEHIWSTEYECQGEPIIIRESENNKVFGGHHLTEYDPYSVMHYPCGLNKNNRQLLLTNFDKAGAIKVYPFK